MLDLKSNHVLRLYLHEFPYLRVKRFDTFFNAKIHFAHASCSSEVFSNGFFKTIRDFFSK